jgi:hypothetical protein
MVVEMKNNLYETHFSYGYRNPVEEEYSRSSVIDEIERKRKHVSEIQAYIVELEERAAYLDTVEMKYSIHLKHLKLSGEPVSFAIDLCRYPQCPEYQAKHPNGRGIQKRCWRFTGIAKKPEALAKVEELKAEYPGAEVIGDFEPRKAVRMKDGNLVHLTAKERRALCPSA